MDEISTFAQNSQLQHNGAACNGVSLVKKLSSQGLKRRRKSPAGISTNHLVFAAHVGNNAELFPEVISLYVPQKSRVADVTYGKGVFWKQIPPGTYRLFATDLSTGTDCCALPYNNENMDCVVLDPPYMHTPGGTAHTNH